jgi:hypothetical protein
VVVVTICGVEVEQLVATLLQVETLDRPFLKSSEVYTRGRKR